MKIGIDIDDVLTQTHKFLIDSYNQENNVNHEFDDHNSYWLEELWGISRKEALSFIDKKYSEGAFEILEHIDDSLPSLKKLKERHELIFITSRPEKHKLSTKKWFAKNFPIEETDLFFAYGAVNKINKTKAEICIDQGISVILEDSLENSIPCANAGIKVILFDKPWNQSLKEHKNVTRVSSWSQALEVIKELDKSDQ